MAGTAYRPNRLNLGNLESYARSVANTVRQASAAVEVTDCEAAPDWFHAAQRNFWNDDHQVVSICAGWQSGKTVSLPPWLKREIQRKGPGDYGAFSSTYKLLSRKLLPELQKEFQDFVIYRSSETKFQFTDEGCRKLWGKEWNGQPVIIQLGHAEAPDSLESATLKAVIWDECGQRLVPEQSFLTVESRLMVNRGRMALASRPYEPGWYSRLVNEAIDGSELVGVTNFPSWANPENPQEDDRYWERQRAKLPSWKFTMLYEGLFTLPAGLIFDCFDWEQNTCDDKPIPDHWRLFPGMDFGLTHVAGVVIAEDPTDKILYCVHEYQSADKKTSSEHAKEIKKAGRLNPGAGGNHQESDSRTVYASCGIMLDEPPAKEVAVQISCVYEQIAERKLIFFRRACSQIIGDLQLYSHEVDDNGDPIDKIADKSKWHRLDALRYIVTKLRPPRPVSISRPAQIKPQTPHAYTTYTPR